MLDLLEELRQLIDTFERQDIPYALCGGLAVSIYTSPRATIDIDLLIPDEAIDSAKEAARSRGFVFEAAPMSFADGKVLMERLSKLDHPKSDDALMLDLIRVTDDLIGVWKNRQQIEWDYGRIWILDKEGLIKLKSLRRSGQDLDDIRRLRDD